MDLQLPVAYEELTLPRFIAGAASRHGDAVALRAPAGEAISYRALEVRTRALARGLMAIGVERGDRVAILLGNGPEFVSCWFACGMAGAVAVPLSTYATPAEIQAMISRSAACVVITQESLARRCLLEELSGTRMPSVRNVVCAGALSTAHAGVLALDEVTKRGDRISEDALEERISTIGPDDEAAILFSSGSTGLPKGVRHAHRAPVIQSWRWAELLDLQPAQRIWSTYPFFWSAGLAVSMGASLAAGATLSLDPVFEPARALERISRESIEMLIVPAHVDVELAAEYRLRPSPLDALRRVRGGTKLLEAAGIAGDPGDLRSGYGLTETFTLVSYSPRGASEERARTTQGRLLPGQELRIVDLASGESLAAGESGDIAVSGATLMLGYLGEPHERAFDAQGFHRPGDVGHFDRDGWFHWEGRSREMIRSRGANIAPVEIEKALAKWGGMKFGRVVGLPHPVLGEAMLVCGVRPEASGITEVDVIEGLRGRVAAYKLPHRVLFFAEDELDMTGTQKVRADALRRLAARRIVDENADPAWTAHLNGIDESQREKSS